MLPQKADGYLFPKKIVRSTNDLVAMGIEAFLSNIFASSHITVFVPFALSTLTA